MQGNTLRNALLANATFSALSGLALVLFSSDAAGLLGIGSPIVYQVLGLGLLGFAGVVIWTATRRPINTFVAMLISLADLLWVAGTIVVILVAYSALKTTGIVAMLGVAAFVLFFGLRQLVGIGRVYAAPQKQGVHRLCVAIETPETADRMWRCIADLASIKRYSPALTHVILRDNAESGINAVRQCTNAKGETWAEHCIAHDDLTRAIEMRFLADESGFPYPFKTMVGGWDVVSTDVGSTVRVWFEVTARHRFLQPLILAVMSKDLAKSFGETVARMVIDARGEAIPTTVNPAQHGISYRLANC